MRKPVRAFRVLASLLLSAVLVPVASAEPPDLELNPVTGYVESVDIDAASGFRVRHVVDRGQGGLGTNTTISSPSANNPRIAIESTGNTWVVWWKAGVTPEVYLRVRDLGTGTWNAETRISNALETSRCPEIVHDGGTAWVVFEVEIGTSSVVKVTGISDGPEPIGGPLAVASTAHAADLDVLAHSVSGHVWITWVDSETHVGWSEYDHVAETWDVPHFESYVGTSVAAARSAIEEAVLGQ